MATPVTEPSIYTQIRTEAEARLKQGSTTSSNWSLGVDALQMLHKLSSNPQTAADALKLLHELQVHQVELDLQREEMCINEHRLVEEFSRYKELYESAPLGYFLIDYLGEIIEINQAGAELFGVGRNELAGGRIDRFLSTDSRPVLAGLLKCVEQNDGGTHTCRVYLESKNSDARPLWFVASASPDKRCVLLACCECP